MIKSIIISKHDFNNKTYYRIGKDGINSYHQGLITSNFQFIFPIAAHYIKIHDTSITVRNNSGNGGKLYDLELNEIWNSDRAISDYAFQNTFLFSNQTNYTGGILNFQGDTLFRSELMRFSDRDIEHNIIVYCTHISGKWGDVDINGNVIVPTTNSYISWKEEEEGIYHLEYYDKQLEKKIRYNPATNKFY